MPITKRVRKPVRKSASKSAPVALKKVVKKKKKQSVRFNIECKNPVEDGIMKVDDFLTYLNERVKVSGKTGQLSANGIKLEVVKHKVVLASEQPFSKRYLKYLTKKYLKKHSLRDWLRVVASNKDTYELRYFHINNEEEGSDDEN